MHFHSGLWKGVQFGGPSGRRRARTPKCRPVPALLRGRAAALTQDGGRSASSATSREASRDQDVEEAGGFGDGVYHDAQGEAGGGGVTFAAPDLWRGVSGHVQSACPLSRTFPGGSASPRAASPRALRGAGVRPRGRREARPTAWARGGVSPFGSPRGASHVGS